jgi:hypothetical protein
MRTRLVPLAILSLACTHCVSGRDGSTTTASAIKSTKQHEDCYEAAQKLGKRADNFIGYGQATSDNNAMLAAKADLASQIRSSVDVVIKDRAVSGARDQLYEATSQISEELVNLRVEARCRSTAGTYEVVLSLSRRSFLQWQEEQIQNQLTEAEQLHKELLAAATPVDRFYTRRRADLFLNRHQSLSSQWDVCRAMSGCTALNLTSWRQLSRDVEVARGRQSFALTSANADAESVRFRMSRLLHEAGINVADSTTPREQTTGTIAATCAQKIFPRSPEFSYRLVEISCQLAGNIHGEQVFQLRALGKGMDNDLNEALKTARDSLSWEGSQP